MKGKSQKVFCHIFRHWPHQSTSILRKQLSLAHQYEPTIIDPLGRPTVPAGSDHNFCSCFRSVRPSPLFKTSQNKRCLKIMIAAGGIVGLAEGINTTQR